MNTAQKKFTLPNTAISASAGSGKTFQLAHRFIGLLLAGFPPERIVALTFSRKAAGEMFDRIIQALCDGAASESGVDELRKNLRISQALPESIDISRDQVLNALRTILETMHRVRVSTLDSFFTGVLQAFPFEFGLGGEMTILEGHAETAARRQALAAVLQNLSSSNAGLRARKNNPDSPLDHLATFIEEFKQATYGQEHKSFTAQIDGFIEDSGTLFTEAPSAELWGDQHTIWPAGTHWLENSHESPRKAVDAMREALGHIELHDKHRERWQTFLSAAESFGGGTITDIKYMLEKLLEITEELENGAAELKMDRISQRLDGPAAEAACDLVHAIVSTSLNARLRSTSGIHSILARFNEYYDDLVRRNGALTFSDVLAVLVGGHELSLRDDGQADRLYVNYRLDTQFDHWLLDEFQDTSTLQWKALQNLADEVLQDTSGERSIFYVGDVKQAIYGWRGGDARLFHAIRAPYGDRIKLRPLTRSFRSSQPVIDVVNKVFDNLADQAGDDLPAPVLERWEQAWGNAHETARKNLAGFTKLISVSRQKNDAAPPLAERRLHVLASELEALRPALDRLSIGILVRTNKSATETAEFLRLKKFEVALEGAFPLTDNPVVSAFLSLVKCTAYPNDTFALRHIQMTPWREKFNRWPTATDRIIDTLGTIHRHGFQELAREWLNAVRDTFDDFARDRAVNLLTAAGKFDATGNRNVADFIDFIADYQVADSAIGAALKVMTIHKSKGLQFDAVFLPDIDGGNGMTTGRSNTFMVCRDESIDRSIKWILDPPQKAIVERDRVLSACNEQLSQDSCYEDLCTLYVAMTRAKHALTLIVDQPSKSSKTVFPSTLVRRGLVADDAPLETLDFAGFTADVEHLSGTLGWHIETGVGPSTPKPSSQQPVVRTNTSRAPRPRRLTPSGSEAEDIPAGMLFHPNATTSATVGDIVHGVMSEIEWIDDETKLDTILRTSQHLPSHLDPAIREAAICELHNIFSSNAIRQALSKNWSPQSPAVNSLDDSETASNKPSVEVWREKRFEVLLDQGWVSGCFDRVVLWKKNDGAVTKALIQDYKTSRINGEEDLERVRKTYTPQMTVYRAALARICGIDEDTITCQLLLTDTGQVLTTDQ
jgi:ATP-dependent helicase/nuclease subunit A